MVFLLTPKLPTNFPPDYTLARHIGEVMILGINPGPFSIGRIRTLHLQCHMLHLRETLPLIHPVPLLLLIFEKP